MRQSSDTFKFIPNPEWNCHESVIRTRQAGGKDVVCEVRAFSDRSAVAPLLSFRGVAVPAHVAGVQHHSGDPVSRHVLLLGVLVGRVHAIWADGDDPGTE